MVGWKPSSRRTKRLVGETLKDPVNELQDNVKPGIDPNHVGKGERAVGRIVQNSRTAFLTAGKVQHHFTGGDDEQFIINEIIILCGQWSVYNALHLSI